MAEPAQGAGPGWDLLHNMPTAADLPPLGETVWFFVPDTEGCIPECMVWDRRGWHLGWWNGKVWNSYVVARPIQRPEVKLWMTITLPGQKLKSPPQPPPVAANDG